MNELAELIRKGLATEGVIENSLVFGAEEAEDNGVFEANIIGLALIGKMGIEEACNLSEKALSESLSRRTKCPNCDRILQELGIPNINLLEKLVALNFKKTSGQIASMLESGELIL